MKCFIKDTECSSECIAYSAQNCILISIANRLENKFNTINSELRDLNRTLTSIDNELSKLNRSSR